ncbi:disulfide bond formation protein B [Bordetella ansorpii]|uniref:Disulfide bond formation protein B n=1 Tax=Bordetella ansorpii TaxID=288768 RepID=A0A146AX77_9BORD|nr:disulfide bond formation protein B [Bordetella ansorpii]CZZ94713.1 disulfide bond formation protein B [Bordetella ansorpii]
MLFVHNAGGRSRLGSSLALLLLSCALILTLAWQVIHPGPSCPLCLLQRGALVLAGVGLLLNVRLGPSPMHYSMVILPSLAGFALAAQQVLMQVVPGAAVSTDTLLGLRWPTWSAAGFLALILFSLLMLIVDRKWGDNALKRPVGLPGMIVMGLFLAAVLSGMAGAVLQCGVGACPVPRTTGL